MAEALEREREREIDLMGVEKFAVYLRGRTYLGDTWYQVIHEELVREVVVSKGKKRRGEEWQTPAAADEDEGIPTIYPVAVIPPDLGFTGGWNVIGEEIYWAGGCKYKLFEREATIYKYLLKHNINHDRDRWEQVYSLNIPRGSVSPILTAVDDRKIAIMNRRFSDLIAVDDDNNLMTQCGGQIYDLHTQSLTYLNSSSCKPLIINSSYEAITVVENPNHVVFYSLNDACLLIVDASTGDIIERIVNFIGSASTFVGIPLESTEPLFTATRTSPAVFHKRTFYWFTSELRLYGYDIDLRKWFQSHCLQQQLHPLKPTRPPKPTLYPLLLGLPNENLAVVVCQKSLFTMASFSVTKDVCNSTLRVKVQHIQHFRTDNRFFGPSQGVAIRLKNAGSGTTQGGVRSAMEA